MLDENIIKPLLNKGMSSLSNAPAAMIVDLQDSTYTFSLPQRGGQLQLFFGALLGVLGFGMLFLDVPFYVFPFLLIFGALMVYSGTVVNHSALQFCLTANDMQIVEKIGEHRKIYTIPSDQPIIFSSKIETYQERVSTKTGSRYATRYVTRQRRVLEISNTYLSKSLTPYRFIESNALLDWLESFFTQVNTLFFGYQPQDIAQHSHTNASPSIDNNTYETNALPPSRAYNKEKYDNATLDVSDVAQEITPVLYNTPSFDDDHYVAVPPDHIALSGRYHNLTKIGSGAQGSMFRALDQNNQPVGIKVYNFLTFQSWKDAELFEREVHTLQSLHFKGIPKYIELIDHNPLYYLVESYIPAPSMAKRIKNGERVSFENALLLLTNIAEVLNYLESLTPPVIHRDIKPDNLLIDDEYNVWLVDFGVVAAANQKTNAMTFAGTAGYMAPEQLMGKVTPAADIYSAGIAMLAYLTGKDPTDMKMNNLSIDVKAELPDSIPAWFKQLLLDMTEPSPDKRLSKAASIVAIIQDHITHSYGNENNPAYNTSYRNPNPFSHSQYV